MKPGDADGPEKGRAAGILEPQFRETPEPERFSRAQRFLDEEEVDSGIVVSRGAEIRFWHLTSMSTWPRGRWRVSAKRRNGS